MRSIASMVARCAEEAATVGAYAVDVGPRADSQQQPGSLREFCRWAKAQQAAWQPARAQPPRVRNGWRSFYGCQRRCLCVRQNSASCATSCTSATVTALPAFGACNGHSALSHADSLPPLHPSTFEAWPSLACTNVLQSTFVVPALPAAMREAVAAVWTEAGLHRLRYGQLPPVSTHRSTASGSKSF